MAKHDAFKVAVHQANREVGQEAGRKFTLTLFTQAEGYPKHRPTLNIPVTGIIKGRLMGLAREKGSHVNFTGLKKNITAWIAESEGWIEHGSRRSSISHPQPPSRAGSEYGSPSTSQAGPEDSSSTAKRRRSSSTSNKMGGFFGGKKPKGK